MEKRNFSRVHFAVGTVIQWNGQNYKGEVANLSLQGMLAAAPIPIPPGEELDITIYLTGTSPQIPIKLHGEVIRNTEHGIAVKFIRMETEAFIHLRNIMAHNIGDSGKVLDELFNYIKHRNETMQENT